MTKEIIDAHVLERLSESTGNIYLVTMIVVSSLLACCLVITVVLLVVRKLRTPPSSGNSVKAITSNSFASVFTLIHNVNGPILP